MLLFGLLLIVIGRPQQADVVFLHGNVYTVNPGQPRAQAIAVKDGRIVYVGSDSGASKYVGRRVIDLHGATVFPGLVDSHFHLSGVGQREMSFNLEGVASLEELLSRVRERVGKAKPGEWIVGRGWIETHWNPPVFPKATELDRVSPANPVYLVRADGHGAVVNSLALKRAGITRETKNPDGGEIMRDASGEANGMVLDRAQGRIQVLIPGPSFADQDEALVRGARFAVEHGLCTVQVAGTTWSEVDRLKRLYEAGKIPVRVYGAIYGPGADAEKLIRDGPQLGYCNDRLTVRDIKVVFDGALGSKGAALLEPYSDYNTSGFLTQRPEVLAPMFERALAAGIQVETHAIGDRANREILNLYEKAFEKGNGKQARWRVEHAQIVHPDDIPRFAKLGVIPSMQPSHAIGDLHFVKSRLGLERMGRGYAWKSFLRAGCVIAGGSDAPVERGDPLIEFYAAVARRDLKGFSGEGWHPEEAVTREEALKMFTLWAAYASFEEKRSGSIEVGKRADLTVLSADIMKIPVERIPSTKVLMTVVGGEVVYRGR